MPRFSIRAVDRHEVEQLGPEELDLIRPWLSLVAIKDMAWSKGKGGWGARVVPVGAGIVRWAEVARGLKESKFAGTVSVHGPDQVTGTEDSA